MSFGWSAGRYRIEIRKPLERSRLQQRLHGGGMKFLLTSAGIKNTSIHDALVDLLGKPIAESSALCIPTASYGHPMAGPPRAWNFISGQEPRCPMIELGWKSLGVLELTALPRIDDEPGIKVVDGTVEVVSEGHWQLFTRSALATESGY